MKRLLFGCGYLGSRVAPRWRDRGDAVTVVTRSPDKAAAFRSEGYDSLVADVTIPESLENLPSADTVLFAVGYDRAAEASIHKVYADGLQNVLDALPLDISRFIYISTTGVYGTAKGAWVDEETEPEPARDGGLAALAAENILRSHEISARGIILRLAGIYGPGRVPFLDLLRAGEAIPAPGSGYLNLIHVDDAALITTLAADANFSSLPQVFCVSDGQPVVRREYYREVARLIGSKPPTFIDAPPDSPRAQRAASNRRVKNDLVTRELGVQLRFPSYREGLAEILARFAASE